MIRLTMELLRCRIMWHSSWGPNKVNTALYACTCAKWGRNPKRVGMHICDLSNLAWHFERGILLVMGFCNYPYLWNLLWYHILFQDYDKMPYFLVLLFCQVIDCGRGNVTRVGYRTGQGQVFDREGMRLCLPTCKLLNYLLCNPCWRFGLQFVRNIMVLLCCSSLDIFSKISTNHLNHLVLVQTNHMIIFCSHRQWDKSLLLQLLALLQKLLSL